MNSDNYTNDLNFNTNVEFANILEQMAMKLKSYSLQQKIEFPKFFKDGTLIKPAAYLNAGVYNIEKFQNPKANTLNLIK